MDDIIKNFPFPTVRDSQTSVLTEIATAFASGYRHIILEAPTGFGKSPVAIASALTLGTSYLCTSTKDLQTQYARVFPFVKMAKGKKNFICAVKDDFIRNGTYRCGLCVSNNVNQCYHKTADYGPCMSNCHFSENRCKYRTFLKDYKLSNKGTREEKVLIDYDTKNHYQKEYSQWSYPENLKEELRVWRPCEYYHQLNIALTSSHSIFNYSNFLSFLPYKYILPSRDLLILDEAHLLETETVRFREISISKRRWKRYVRHFKIVDYAYHDIEKWIDFLIELETRMLVLTGNESMVEELSISRREIYNWTRKKDSSNDKRIVGASELFESDKEIAEKYDTYSFRGSSIGEELAVEVIRDIKGLTKAINNILSNPKNWIESKIKKEGYEVIMQASFSYFCIDSQRLARSLLDTMSYVDKIEP